jgi:hypothetical protein
MGSQFFLVDKYQSHIAKTVRPDLRNANTSVSRRLVRVTTRPRLIIGNETDRSTRLTRAE